MRQPTIYIVLKDGQPMVFSDRPSTVYIYNKDVASSKPWVYQTATHALELMTDENRAAFEEHKASRATAGL